MASEAALCAELRSDIALLRHEIRMMELRRQLEIQVNKGDAAWQRLIGACALWVIVNAAGAFGAMFVAVRLLAR